MILKTPNFKVTNIIFESYEHFPLPNIRWSRDSPIECLICNYWNIGLDFSNIYPAYSWMYLVSGRLLKLLRDATTEASSLILEIDAGVKLD
jgi:hypothetical protein